MVPMQTLGLLPNVMVGNAFIITVIQFEFAVQGTPFKVEVTTRR